jgi:hypothetical protein
MATACLGFDTVPAPLAALLKLQAVTELPRTVQ